MSKATISRDVDELEQQLAVRLQHRTARKVNVLVTFGIMHGYRWPAFLARHPRLSLDITLSDRMDLRLMVIESTVISNSEAPKAVR